MKRNLLLTYFSIIICFYAMFPIAQANEVDLRAVIEDKQNVLNLINAQIEAKQLEWEQADLAVQNNPVTLVSYTGNGLLAELYNNAGYNASPPLPGPERKVYETNVPNINYSWGGGSAFGLLSEDFVIKFSGTITSTTDKTVTFYAPGDDGVKLYIDGQLIIDDWIDKGGGGSVSAPISFQANVSKQVTLWFYENGGGANVWLYWDNEIVPAEAFKTATITTTIDQELLSVANRLYDELQALIDEREVAEANFAQAIANLSDYLASQVPATTPEPIEEPTLESTPIPIPEPIVEPTPVSTIEPTPEPVVEPVVEPTPVPTPVATPEPLVVMEPPAPVQTSTPEPEPPIQPVISVPEIVVPPSLPINVTPAPEEPTKELPEPEITFPEEPVLIIQEPTPEVIVSNQEPSVSPSVEPTPAPTEAPEIQEPEIQEPEIQEPEIQDPVTPEPVTPEPSVVTESTVESTPEPSIQPEEPQVTPKTEVIVEEKPIVEVTGPNSVSVTEVITQEELKQKQIEADYAAQMSVDMPNLAPEAVLEEATEAVTATAEFVADLFTDPMKALETLNNIGSSMTEEERETARQVVVPVILVNNIISAMGVTMVRRF